MVLTATPTAKPSSLIRSAFYRRITSTASDRSANPYAPRGRAITKVSPFSDSLTNPSRINRCTKASRS